jgi:hypothetical protein
MIFTIISGEDPNFQPRPVKGSDGGFLTDRQSHSSQFTSSESRTEWKSKVNDISPSVSASENRETSEPQITDQDHTHFHIPTTSNTLTGPRIDETIIDISCNVQDCRGRVDKCEKIQDQNQNKDEAKFEPHNYNYHSGVKKTSVQTPSHNKSQGSLAGGRYGKAWETQGRRESNQESCRRKQQEEVSLNFFGHSYVSHTAESLNGQRNLKPRSERCICSQNQIFSNPKFNKIIMSKEKDMWKNVHEVRDKYEFICHECDQISNDCGIGYHLDNLRNRF